MTDTELIGYCDIHCETQRALFSAEHINRMIELAGNPEGWPHLTEGFYSMHEAMKDLCRLAEAKLDLCATTKVGPRTWVIQENLLNTEQQLLLAHMVVASGGRVIGVQLLPFSDDLVFSQELTTKDVIPYGSTKLMKIAQKLGWTGLFLNDNFNTMVWNANRKDMLNADAFVFSLGSTDQLLRSFSVDNSYFIRPIHDLKDFAGTVASILEIENWRNGGVFGSFQPDEDTLVAMSPLQEIRTEHRWFIVKGEVVTGAMYRRYGKLQASVEHHLDVAQSLADVWLPHENCVMDTAYLESGELKVVEFNCLNASGFYGHSVKRLVEALNH